MEAILISEKQFHYFANNEEDACPYKEVIISEVKFEQEYALAKRYKYIKYVMDQTELKILKKGLTFQK